MAIMTVHKVYDRSDDEHWMESGFIKSWGRYRKLPLYPQTSADIEELCFWIDRHFRRTCIDSDFFISAYLDIKFAHKEALRRVSKGCIDVFVANYEIPLDTTTKIPKYRLLRDVVAQLGIEVPDSPWISVEHQVLFVNRLPRKFETNVRWYTTDDWDGRYEFATDIPGYAFSKDVVATIDNIPNMFVWKRDTF